MAVSDDDMDLDLGSYTPPLTCTHMLSSVAIFTHVYSRHSIHGSPACVKDIL